MLKVYLLALLPIFCLTACSNPEPSTVPAQGTETIPGVVVTTAEEFAKMDYVKCASGRIASCPTNVGYIHATTPTGDEKMNVGVCTGWILGPDLIATNSHCIPEDLKRDGADCSGRIAITFPLTLSLKEETLSCRKIVHATKIAGQGDPESLMKADFAVFQLTAPTARPVIETSREGIVDGETYTVHSVDPTKQLPNDKIEFATLREQTCIARKKTPLILDEELNSPVTVLTGPNCRAIPGNSGSVVLNSYGIAVGVVHAGIALEKTQNPLPGMKFELTDLPSYMTSFRCLPSIANLGVPDSSCNLESHSERVREFMKAAEEKEIAPIKLEMAARLSKREAGALYKMELAPLGTRIGLTLIIEPYCTLGEAPLFGGSRQMVVMTFDRTFHQDFRTTVSNVKSELEREDDLYSSIPVCSADDRVNGHLLQAGESSPPAPFNPTP